MKIAIGGKTYILSLSFSYNINMSQLSVHYTELRDQIKMGSISISSEDYPFSAFCLGYLFAKTSIKIEALFEIMETLDSLHKSKIFSIIIIKQVL